MTVAGLALQAVALGWFAVVLSPTVPYTASAVAAHEAGQASGATNAIREVGGVLGVAVLAAVFSGTGSYASPHLFVLGLVPAVLVGAGVLGAGALIALLVPGRGAQPALAPVAVEIEPAALAA